MFFLFQSHRSHYLQSKRPSQSCSSSALWRRAASWTTVSRGNPEHVWLICCSSSSSPWTPSQQCSGVIRSYSIMFQMMIDDDACPLTHTVGDSDPCSWALPIVLTAPFSPCSSPVFVLQCNMEYIDQLLSRYAVNRARGEYGSGFKIIRFLK